MKRANSSADTSTAANGGYPFMPSPGGALVLLVAMWTGCEGEPSSAGTEPDGDATSSGGPSSTSSSSTSSSAGGSTAEAATGGGSAGEASDSSAGAAGTPGGAADDCTWMEFPVVPDLADEELHVESIDNAEIATAGEERLYLAVTLRSWESDDLFAGPERTTLTAQLYESRDAGRTWALRDTNQGPFDGAVAYSVEVDAGGTVYWQSREFDPTGTEPAESADYTLRASGDGANWETVDHVALQGEFVSHNPFDTLAASPTVPGLVIHGHILADPLRDVRVQNAEGWSSLPAPSDGNPVGQLWVSEAGDFYWAGNRREVDQWNVSRFDSDTQVWETVDELERCFWSSARAMVETESGFYVVGSCLNGLQYDDWIVRYSPSGNAGTWSALERITRCTQESDLCQDAWAISTVADASGRVYVAGWIDETWTVRRLSNDEWSTVDQLNDGARPWFATADSKYVYLLGERDDGWFLRRGDCP